MKTALFDELEKIALSLKPGSPLFSALAATAGAAGIGGAVMEQKKKKRIQEITQQIAEQQKTATPRYLKNMTEVIHGITHAKKWPKDNRLASILEMRLAGKQNQPLFKGPRRDRLLVREMTPPPSGSTKELWLKAKDSLRDKAKTSAVLSLQHREKLPTKDFAIPARKAKAMGTAHKIEGESKGRYPVNDPTHARAALSMVAKHGTETEKAMVRAKVRSKYPGIGKDAEYDHENG